MNKEKGRKMFSEFVTLGRWRGRLQVIDAPAYRWRGMLLDVGRHFFEVPFILKVLDICALYKLNKFHWHLTEDQVRPCSAASSEYWEVLELVTWTCRVAWTGMFGSRHVGS